MGEILVIIRPKKRCYEVKSTKTSPKRKTPKKSTKGHKNSRGSNRQRRAVTETPSTGDSNCSNSDLEDDSSASDDEEIPRIEFDIEVFIA